MLFNYTRRRSLTDTVRQGGAIQLTMTNFTRTCQNRSYSMAPLPKSQNLTYIFLEVNFSCGWVDDALHSHGANMADVTLGQGQLHWEEKMQRVGEIKAYGKSSCFTHICSLSQLLVSTGRAVRGATIWRFQGVWFSTGFLELSGFDVHPQASSKSASPFGGRTGTSPPFLFPIAYAFVSHPGGLGVRYRNSLSSSWKKLLGSLHSLQSSTDLWRQGCKANHFCGGALGFWPLRLAHLTFGTTLLGLCLWNAAPCAQSWAEWKSFSIVSPCDLELLAPLDKGEKAIHHVTTDSPWSGHKFHLFASLLSSVMN